MFARVSTYEGFPGKAKEGERAIAEITPAMQEFPGFQKAYLLVDDKSGKAISISHWETEDHARRSTSPAGVHRERIARAIGASGEPVVEIFEHGFSVEFSTERGRFARTSVYKGSPDKVEDGIREVRNTESRLKQMRGCQQLHLLVDRKSGKAMTLSFWDSEEALNQSASGVNPLRDSIARALGATEKPTIQSFEIVGEISQRMRKAA